MAEKCICHSPNVSLADTHYRKLNMKMILLKDDEGYGAVILKDNMAIGCFDINYCPKCGKKL